MNRPKHRAYPGLWKSEV